MESGGGDSTIVARSNETRSSAVPTDVVREGVAMERQVKSTSGRPLFGVFVCVDVTRRVCMCR